MTTLQLGAQLVNLDVLVTEKKTGAVVQGLTLNDFQVEENGRPERLRYLSQDALPLSIVFLFDLTGSVQPQLRQLGTAAKEVLGHLRPEDEVAVATFDARIRMVQPFTADPNVASDAIRKAATESSKAATFLDEDMYEAVDQALQSTQPNSRRVLVWFTDGTANLVNPLTRGMSNVHAGDVLHTREEAREKLLRSGVSVSALIIRPPAEDAMLAFIEVNPLAWATGMAARLGDFDRYAAETGGPVVKASGRDAPAKLGTLLDEIRQRYTLSYAPATVLPAGTLCKVRVRMTDGLLRTHPELLGRTLTLRTRSEYYR